MKINVKRIPVEGEHLEGVEPPAVIDLDEPDVAFRHEIEYDLLATVQGDALLVVGRLQTPVTLRCSRCLKTFQQPLIVPQFVYHQDLQGQDFVDLTANMREDIILELPQRALCDANCKGLCPRCGANLNEGACQCRVSGSNPRWQALDQLKLT